MIGNDERRRVAERLRCAAEQRQPYTQPTLACFIEADCMDIWTRLADLIDPRTCTVDEWRWTDDDDPMPHMCVTSLSCGHEAVTLYGAPRYCPECGAKMINDGA